MAGTALIVFSSFFLSVANGDASSGLEVSADDMAGRYLSFMDGMSLRSRR